ncbi:hypothetical protein FOS14_04870 [Skermania sp. ID1734]|uniref:zinc ribbon domain-containing protein n=1 Tax=Skermania sp. ID1734 TaxID=2597516 RepID=UPI00117E9BAF|nr:C4-type zinc ribbon domain-containing protein [Skermania sp. ID1734]TSE01084.1 hypothetical protein FOS14_04870 [Skermania sp. ID1734]
MKVEPSIQAQLLELAKIDTELTRIAHRRKSLPEQQEVDRLETEKTARKDAAVAVEIAMDDLDRDIRKLETEVDGVRKREQRDRAMLAAGTVGAKQLTELQHELDTLIRRQQVLEDELLEVMERREAAEADHQHAGAQLSRAEDELIDAARRRDDAMADLNVAEQRCNADRSAVLDQLPTELVADYDRRRSRSGIGAALLQARRCGGCRIELDRGAIAEIAHAAPELVVHCPECGTILVRTKESGL